MKILLLLSAGLVFSGCSGGVSKKDPDLIKNQSNASSLLSSMGEILKSDHSATCTVIKNSAVCDLGSPTCTHSDFELTVSGRTCGFELYFRNETRAVTGGSRGTFTWKVKASDSLKMPSYIESIDVSGSQEYKNNGTLISGKVRLDGHVITKNSKNEKTEHAFVIDGRDDFSTANQNSVGHSDIKLILEGSNIVEGVKKPFLVTLNEQTGFNSNRGTQTLNYFLDGKSISLNQFKTFSEQGITFFFKSTSTSASKPWLGYTGPIKDFLQIPSEL